LKGLDFGDTLPSYFCLNPCPLPSPSSYLIPLPYLSHTLLLLRLTYHPSLPCHTPLSPSPFNSHSPLALPALALRLSLSNVSRPPPLHLALRHPSLLVSCSALVATFLVLLLLTPTVSSLAILYHIRRLEIESGQTFHFISPSSQSPFPHRHLPSPFLPSSPFSHHPPHPPQSALAMLRFFLPPLTFIRMGRGGRLRKVGRLGTTGEGQGKGRDWGRRVGTKAKGT